MGVCLVGIPRECFGGLLTLRGCLPCRALVDAFSQRWHFREYRCNRKGTQYLNDKASPAMQRKDGLYQPIILGNPNQKPETRNPKPGTRNPEPGTRNPELGTWNPRPQNRNPIPETRNPKPETRLARPRSPPASTALKVRPLSLGELRLSSPDTAAVDLPLLGYDAGSL